MKKRTRHIFATLFVTSLFVGLFFVSTSSERTEYRSRTSLEYTLLLHQRQVYSSIKDAQDAETLNKHLRNYIKTDTANTSPLYCNNLDKNTFEYVDCFWFDKTKGGIEATFVFYSRVDDETSYSDLFKITHPHLFLKKDKLPKVFYEKFNITPEHISGDADFYKGNIIKTALILSGDTYTWRILDTQNRISHHKKQVYQNLLRGCPFLFSNIRYRSCKRQLL